MHDIFENIDSLTLQEKFESARKSAEAAPKDPKLQAQVQLALRANIKRLQEYAKANPDDKFVKANQDLLKGGSNDEVLEGAAEEPQTWIAAGTVNLSGFVCWTLGGSIMFDPTKGNGFLFGAKGGPDFAFDVFISSIIGEFVVDPAIIRNSMREEQDPILGTVFKGSCNFQLAQLGVAETGGVRISFSSLTGTYWGMLGGIAVGLGVASTTGQCDMIWSQGGWGG